jgi:hypothetical protein
MNQSKIAKKAVRTRQARQAFRDNFGVNTYLIVEAVLDRIPSDIIADTMGISKGSVAAVKANLNRGTYAPYVTKGGRGTAKLG